MPDLPGPTPAANLSQNTAPNELLPSSQRDHDGESATCQYERRRLGDGPCRGDDSEIIVDVRREKDVANNKEIHRTRRHIHLQVFLVDLELQRRARCFAGVGRGVGDGR